MMVAKLPLVRWVGGFLLGLGLALGLALPLPALPRTMPLPVAQLAPRLDRLNQGIQLYQAERWTTAASVLEELVQPTTASDLARGLAFNYLALIYQKQGRWPEATRAVQAAIATLQSPAVQTDPAATLALAQTLNTQGQLQLNLGQAATALQTWEQATATYRRAEDLPGVLLSLINQAQALQAQGLYQQALERLKQVAVLLNSQPDSHLKAVNLRRLGNALQQVGDQAEARRNLDQSRELATAIADAEALAEALLSLGNLEQSQRNWPLALDFYQRAAAIAPTAIIQMQAQLNQLVPLLETQQLQAAQALLPAIQAELATLPPNRTTIESCLYLIKTVIQLRQAAGDVPLDLPTWRNLAQMGAIAIQQAQDLGDLRTQAYATGLLGQVYEQTQQWAIAQQLTQQALLLAQAAQAPDITYRWQWQAGRLWQKQGQAQGSAAPVYRQAIAAYSGAVETLKTLRRDLVAVNPDAQFSFRDSIEPVYREFVSLLLQPPQGEPSAANLIQARNTIEALQLAELEDFFRQSCLDARPAQIDQVDVTAAIIYPIILTDRLEVIASLPGQGLRHYVVPRSQAEVEAVVQQLAIALLDQTSFSYLPLFQQVYNWLIRPVAAELGQSQVKTLVFVLDGAMRSIPVAALHDGRQYLIEQYSVALTPGLQLLDVKPLRREQLQVLTGALTESRQGYQALPNVAREVAQIQAEVSSQVLLNEAFTTAALKLELQSFPGPIVHLATHGEFSSRVAGTFILTWDGRIDINQLHQFLQTRGAQQQPIELLVLSACRTAVGDNQAALGLAGVAVRAGARSTIGTLWYVDDAATASVMAQFYREFAKANVSKAEALRQAQLQLLRNPTYQHPYFWAAYLLVGNWL